MTSLERFHYILNENYFYLENMENDFYSLLKELKLKATPKRIAIMEIMAGQKTYMSPEEVRSRLKNRFKNIGLPTVYRNLEELAKEGVIIKIIHPDRKLYYFYCQRKEHHHHFVCVLCRRVEDINFCGMTEIKKEVEEGLKGHMVSHMLLVYGFCKHCLVKQTVSL
ncbi:MAG TPA: transcriptional repressor [Syntrophorhabdaceae bacterium]|nr:transcriptional repressor [Syntrophorhabdaceae bacterium]